MDLKQHLYLQIGERIRFYQKKSGLSKKKFEGGDGSLISYIERGEFKQKNTSLIPNSAMDSIMSTINANEYQLSEFELVYGDKQEFRSFLKYLFDYVAFNIESPEPQLDMKKWDERIHYDAKFNDLSRTLIDAASFDGHFSYIWEERIDEMTFSAHVPYAGPYNLFGEDVTNVVKAFGRLFKLVEEKMVKSYKKKFESDGNTSMQKLEKRITEWLLTDFHQILSDVIKENKADDIRSVGYNVKALMEESMTLKDHGRLQENKWIGPGQPRVGNESYELETSIRELAIAYVKSAKEIADKQNKVLNLSETTDNNLELKES